MEGQLGQNSEGKGYQTLCRRNKDDLRRTNGRQNAEVPEKNTRERNKQRPFTGPFNEVAKE